MDRSDSLFASTSNADDDDDDDDGGGGGGIRREFGDWALYLLYGFIVDVGTPGGARTFLFFFVLFLVLPARKTTERRVRVSFPLSIISTRRVRDTSTVRSGLRQ